MIEHARPDFLLSMHILRLFVRFERHRLELEELGLMPKLVKANLRVRRTTELRKRLFVML